MLILGFILKWVTKRRKKRAERAEIAKNVKGKGVSTLEQPIDPSDPKAESLAETHHLSTFYESSNTAVATSNGQDDEIEEIVETQTAQDIPQTHRYA